MNGSLGGRRGRMGKFLLPLQKLRGEKKVRKNSSMDMVVLKTHNLSEDTFVAPKKKRSTQRKYRPYFCGRTCNRELNPLCPKNNFPSNGVLP